MACRVLPEMLKSRCNILVHLILFSAVSSTGWMSAKGADPCPIQRKRERLSDELLRSEPWILDSTGTMAQFIDEQMQHDGGVVGDIFHCLSGGF